MDNVVFDEGPTWVRKRAEPHSNSKLVQRIVAQGLAKDAAGANRLLVGVCAALFIIAIAAPFILTSEETELPPQSTVDAAMKRIPAR